MIQNKHMNNPAFRPKSIDDYGGIDGYLAQTASQHNGLDARIFRLCVRARVSDAALARMFNIASVNTIKSWKAKLGTTP